MNAGGAAEAQATRFADGLSILLRSILLRMIGLGMAAAIAIDALIVRTILVPAVMHTQGKANWYLPAWFDRRLPHITIDKPANEGVPTTQPTGNPA
jgi:hypothetical protein